MMFNQNVITGPSSGTTVFSLLTYAGFIQSFRLLKPRPFKFSPSSTFACHTHISTANQQPMHKTNSPSNIFFFKFS